MNKLIALCYFVLSLYGCDVGGNTFVHRTQQNGTDTLYSKVIAQPGVARFKCLRSASGQCHYTLFPNGCASTAEATGKRNANCKPGPPEHFAIAIGQSHQVATLQSYRLCVSAEAVVPGTHCEVLESIAAR
ncbi:MAG: hypothetical protein LC715_03430 [Gammaproteobacteria bacterium]|nr:hypothetical protein [Gammaproteobacteria bacterium]